MSAQDHQGSKKIERAGDDKQFYAFLPAAIEIERTPPPVYSRLILWGILSLVVLSLAWAWFGRVDIVAVAPGKIIPLGQVKIIQPAERGVINHIHVREGQAVKAGDVLLSLDAASIDADVKRLGHDLNEARALWLIESAYRQYIENPHDRPSGPDELATMARTLDLPMPIENIEHASLVLEERVAEYRSGLAVLAEQRLTLESEKNAASTSLHRYQLTLPIVRERADSHKALYARHLVSKDLYLQLEQQHIEQQQAYNAEQFKIAALGARIAEIDANTSLLKGQQSVRNLEALSEHRGQAYALRQTLGQAQIRQRQTRLRAPIDGTVQQLKIHTIGGIVTPAETLMLLIPDSATLEIETWISNHDIGFVHEGQLTAVKVDTFDFTRYGAIEGELRLLSADAVVKENQGLVYPARVSLSKSSLAIGDKDIELSPGMAVTVEIKIGTRRILEFFMAPLLKFTSESLRER